ncbi:MAG: serine/threonine-protein kinase, partial [Myxococcota bacterium]|nr:serine/threonine-protein kinase [Myxococcota bacterium]
RFNHPHIVTIYGVGEADEQPYVALEYLEGRTLRERLLQEPVGAREVMRLGIAIADALAEAHAHGVLHRDLKPENVILPKDGRVRVLDFGLAKALHGPGLAESSLEPEERANETVKPLPVSDPRALSSAVDSIISTATEGQRVFGTPPYMAPEQWAGEGSSEATDVWSLGTTLFELVEGRRPYHEFEDAPMSLIFQVSSNKPVPVPPSFNEIPSELGALILQCLEKEPDRRPTAKEANRALELMLLRGGKRPPPEEGPFRGMEPFTEEHGGVFFGRSAEVAGFLERLREEAVLPVVGPPGVGKTSFVRGGVIPRLMEQASWRSSWKVLHLSPGADPFQSLATRLLIRDGTPSPGAIAAVPELAGASAAGPIEDVGDEGTASEGGAAPGFAPLLTGILAGRLRNVPALLGLMLREQAERERCRILLFVDQLEELYQRVPDEDVRRAFMESLSQAADEPGGPVRVVFALRDAFLGRAAESPRVREVLGRVVVLQPADTTALEEVLTGPLEAVNASFEDPGLALQMIEEVRMESRRLALLQLVGLRLWRRRDRSRRMLLRSEFESVGGVLGALAAHAEATVDALTGPERRRARELILALVDGDGQPRARTPEAVIEGLPADAPALLDRLLAARVLTVARVGGGDGAVEIELFHSSLVRTWDRLARWVAESREQQVVLAELEQAAALWERGGRRGEDAPLGDILSEARLSLSTVSLEVPPPVALYLEAGAERERQVHSRRRWVNGIAMVLLAVVAAGGLLLAGMRGRQAQELDQDRHAVETQAAAAFCALARSELAAGHTDEARAALRSSLELADTAEGRALWATLTADGGSGEELGYCALLIRVWDSSPAVWGDTGPVDVRPDPGHPCAPATGDASEGVSPSPGP